MDFSNKMTVRDGKDMKKTYIVSGHPRSGTSMMMHALITGGITGAYSSPIVQKANAAYSPNPNGFFELVEGEQQDPWHPWRHQGKVFKCIYGMLPQIAPGNYKVVYMLRDPAEIRKSMFRMKSRTQNIALSDEDYFAKMSRYISIGSVRRDMEILPVWYSDVLSNPQEQFARIKDFGVPIAPEKAASIVNTKLYRNRSESGEL